MQRLFSVSVCPGVIVLGLAFSPAWAQEDAGNSQDQVFKQLDKNGDGKLTADEIGDDQKPAFERLLRVGDKDKNGELTLDEFRAGLKPDERPVQTPAGRPEGAGGPGRPPFDPGQAFDMFDRNKDGKLTLEELPEGFRERMKPLFERLGKSEVSKEEFSEAARRFAPAPPAGGFDRGAFFDRSDANKDGKLTVAEVPDFAKRIVRGLLERAGKPEDGELTKEEFEKFAPQAPFPGGAPQIDNPAEAFKRLDTNNDGKLTLAEASDRARFLVRAFLQRAGKGEDGELTQEEFVKLAAQRPAEPPQNPQRRPEGGPEFFRLLDTDKDGRLSKDELSKASELLDRLDRNKDGQLDPSELFGQPGPPPNQP